MKNEPCMRKLLESVNNYNLNELYDSSRPHTVVTNNNDLYSAAFLVKEVDGVDKFDPLTFDPENYEHLIIVRFRRVGVNTWDLFFIRNGRDTHMTGGGDAIVILSTVINIIKEFISQVQKPTKIVFDSNNRSRSKVYSRILKILEKEKNIEVVDYTHSNGTASYELIIT